MQVFSSFETLFYAFFRLIRSYTKIFALFFDYFLDFSYLCRINQNIKSHVTKIKSINHPFRRPIRLSVQ